MPATLRDRYGVEVEAADEAAVAVFDEAVHSLVGLEGDPVAAANAAAADPSLPLARCLAAYLHCYSASQSGYARARAVVGAARPAGMRERAHFAAASAWADGDLEAAVRHLERVLLRDPRDLLALKVAQDLYFSLGDRVNLRDVVARVLPAWAAGTPGAGFVRGMYAFGLEECGDYRAAERYGRAAIDANGRDAWAAHAVIHVFEMEGRQADGLAFVAATSPDWGPSFFAVHNWWHSALYHLELGQLDAALAVYDDRVAAEGLATPLGQLDAASLLWRLWLLGVEPGDRASELADAFTAWAHDSAHVFNDWHATMALTLAGRIADAEALAAELPARARGTNRFMVERAGLDVTRGVIAVGRGELKRAVGLLSRARPHAHVFGGSHAQRDAIDLTLLAAAAAAAADPVSGGATDDALVRALVAERVARKRTAERAARLIIDASRARARRRGRAQHGAPRTPQRM